MKDLLSLLPIVAIFLIFWLLVIRPASRRQREMRQVQSELNIGDRIVTQSGFFGTVARLDDDKLGLELADGVVVTMARQAVVGVVNEEHLSSTDPETGQTPEADTAQTRDAEDSAEREN